MPERHSLNHPTDRDRYAGHHRDAPGGGTDTILKTSESQRIPKPLQLKTAGIPTLHTEWHGVSGRTGRFCHQNWGARFVSAGTLAPHPAARSVAACAASTTQPPVRAGLSGRPTGVAHPPRDRFLRQVGLVADVLRHERVEHFPHIGRRERCRPPHLPQERLGRHAG